MIRILIVDDHEILREGMKTILETEDDFEIVGESASAEGLLDLVGRSQPDVVLLDAKLPGVSGPEACRRLTAAYPDVRVLIVTTFTDDDLVDECIAAGAKGYVVKHIERFNLKHAIRAVHRGEGVIDPAVVGRLLDRMRSGEGRPGEDNRPPFSEVQFDILRLISEGFSNREIAARVHLSENTVKSHVQEIFRRLEVRNRVEAALRATREGWV
jgi:DNA-binding NarL/FixJ family response regulator